MRQTEFWQFYFLLLTKSSKASLQSQRSNLETDITFHSGFRQHFALQNYTLQYCILDYSEATLTNLKKDILMQYTNEYQQAYAISLLSYAPLSSSASGR